MSKIRASARGQDCTLALHPYCNGDPATVVLAHLNSPGKGMGMKSPDWHAVYACSTCHDILDRRQGVALSEVEVLEATLRALYRTHLKLFEDGVLRSA